MEEEMEIPSPIPPEMMPSTAPVIPPAPAPSAPAPARGEARTRQESEEAGRQAEGEGPWQGREEAQSAGEEEEGRPARTQALPPPGSCRPCGAAAPPARQ